MSPLQITTPEVLRDYAVKQLRSWIAALDQKCVTVRIPKLIGQTRSVPNMPYHLEPEVFLQITGITTFQFPEESFDVMPGEICIVPVGMPHAELARPYQKQPYLNIMFGYFYLDHLHYHLANQRKDGRPFVFVRENLLGFNVQHLVAQINTIIDRFHGNAPSRLVAVKAGLIHHFFDILYGLEHPAQAQETNYVSRVKDLLRTQLANPNLSVEWIATQLKLSPDHVSRLYRKATGQYLAHTISERRLDRAKYLLEFSSMTISEISHAVGYENPNYLSRVFRQATQQSPREYRADHQKK